MVKQSLKTITANVPYKDHSASTKRRGYHKCKHRHTTWHDILVITTAELVVNVWVFTPKVVWHWCVLLSRTWTSTVHLKTPCRPSLLTSDRPSSPLTARCNPARLRSLSLAPSWTDSCGCFTVSSLLTVVTLWVMCLLLQHLCHTHTHTHLCNTCVCVFEGIWGSSTWTHHAFGHQCSCPESYMVYIRIYF